MTRIRFGRFAVAGLAVALTFAAATHVRADFKSIQAAITKSARIPFPAASATSVSQPHSGSAKKATATVSPSGATFLQLKQSLTGHKAQRVPAIKLTTGQQSTSTVDQVGSPPAGTGTTFNWDRSTPSVLLVVFVNAADPLGVSITGLQTGDQVQITGASGLASFSKNTGNSTLSSFLGLVADGTAAVVGALVPGAQVSQPIEAAGQQAANLFGAVGDNSPGKLRDAFGVEPSTHGYGLEEGGVVVCMPQGNGAYYSSDPNHRSYWASMPSAVGQPRGLPSVYKSESSLVPFFFIGQQNTNTAICQSNNPLYLLAWDFAYGDNIGYYEVVVQLTQANAIPAPPPIFKTNPTKKK